MNPINTKRTLTQSLSPQPTTTHTEPTPTKRPRLFALNAPNSDADTMDIDPAQNSSNDSMADPAALALCTNALEQANHEAYKQLMIQWMFLAFCQKDKLTVQQLLQDGVDVNAFDEDGSTPLMWAAQYGWLDIMKDLFPKCSNDTINAVDNLGNTALLLACCTLTDIPFLTSLLAQSSVKTINAVDNQGNTALLLACCKLTDTSFLTRLLAQSSMKTINVVNNQGNTALLIACSALTDIPFLTSLLAQSSVETINVMNKRHHTPLFFACTALTDIPFLTQLLEHSSPETINAVSKYNGSTALSGACGKLTDISFLTRLLTQSSDESVNAVNKKGCTALITLMRRTNNPQLAEHLLPILLPRLTLKNLQSAYKSTNGTTAKTAWQRAHGRGEGPWTDIASRIGEAMLMECALHHIPWGKLHYKSATQKKRLTQEEQTPATVCEDILKQMEIPADILGIIRNYNESPFSTPKEALDVINDFLKRHLQQKEQYKEDSSQLFESVNDVMNALHDSKSPLNLSLAEYASTLNAP